MAFVVSKLENDLKKVFSDMKDAGENVTVDMFTDGIAQACADFVQTGSVTTVDTGTIPAGTFTGSGTGQITVQASLLKSALDIACNAMSSMPEGGDDVLANALGSGMFAMSGAAVVDTNIVGTVVSPSGVPSPISGTGKGVIVCVQAPLVSSITSCFSLMKQNAGNEGFDGDSYFASELSKAVLTYWTSGTITVNGLAPLVGSVGSGTVA